MTTLKDINLRLKRRESEHYEQAWRGRHLFKHGLRYVPEYNAWCNMKGRCYNKNRPRYAEWGGRGISVCDRWLNDFKAFYTDMGPKPSATHSLERIDNLKGYSPDNCKWATPKEQSENRPSWVNLITFRGQTKTMTEWAKFVGIGRKTLYDRFKWGWTIEEALTTPRLQSKRYFK